MDGTTYKVVISDAALSMLDSHIDFLARVNQKAAKELMNTVLNDMASLSENPQRYPSYESQFVPPNRYRKMLTSKRYLILYEIVDTNVNVDYIVDSRQDYEWLIQ